MFRADLYAADLASYPLERLAVIIRNGADILEQAIRTDTVDQLKAEGHFADQDELMLAELRRRGF